MDKFSCEQPYSKDGLIFFPFPFKTNVSSAYFCFSTVPLFFLSFQKHTFAEQNKGRVQAFNIVVSFSSAFVS